MSRIVKGKNLQQYYAKLKRKKLGKCNICLHYKELTWDHVPPKGGIELQAMEINSIAELMIKDYVKDFKNIAPEGIQFRTICEECNCEILGGKLDPILNEFHKTLSRFLKSKLHFPDEIKIKTKPVSLIKAVIGHMLASKIELDDSLFDTKLRGVFIGDGEIPEDVNVYYWIYPYNRQTVIRDIAMMNVLTDSKKVVLMNLIKYFPIAYLVTDAVNFDNVNNLSVYKHLGIDDEIEIPIKLNNIKPINFPETSTDGYILFMGNAGNNSIVGNPVIENIKVENYKL